MEYSDNYVSISHIEQYTYCPRQAENNINGLSLKNTNMEDGEKEHIKNDVRNKFKKSIQQNTINGKIREIVQKIISDALTSHNSIRLSEVAVKSEKLKIMGKIDEVRIDKGNISLIEYKTTFRKEKSNDFSISAVNQIIAYSIALKEYFNLSCTLTLKVRRVYLSYDNWISYDDLKSNDELGSVNDEGKMITSYWDANLSKDIYDQIYSEDNLRVDEIKEIIKNIQSKNFKHKGNPNKCKFCQYNKGCDYSLISK